MNTQDMTPCQSFGCSLESRRPYFVQNFDYVIWKEYSGHHVTNTYLYGSERGKIFGDDVIVEVMLNFIMASSFYGFTHSKKGFLRPYDETNLLEPSSMLQMCMRRTR